MISLHFNVSVAPFKFVPLKLTVEPDVNVDPKCQDQISDRLFCGRWSLRNVVSRYGKSSIKGHSQLMHTRIRYHFLADLHVTRRA